MAKKNSMSSLLSDKKKIPDHSQPIVDNSEQIIFNTVSHQHADDRQTDDVFASCWQLCGKGCVFVSYINSFDPAHTHSAHASCRNTHLLHVLLSHPKWCRRGGEGRGVTQKDGWCSLSEQAGRVVRIQE